MYIFGTPAATKNKYFLNVNVKYRHYRNGKSVNNRPRHRLGSGTIVGHIICLGKSVYFYIQLKSPPALSDIVLYARYVSYL